MVKIVSGGGGVFKTDKRIFHKLMQGYLLVFKIGKTVSCGNDIPKLLYHIYVKPRFVCKRRGNDCNVDKVRPQCLDSVRGGHTVYFYLYLRVFSVKFYYSVDKKALQCHLASSKPYYRPVTLAYQRKLLLCREYMLAGYGYMLKEHLSARCQLYALF